MRYHLQFLRVVFAAIALCVAFTTAGLAQEETAASITGHLKAELRYRFSPWHFRCRLDDIADAQRLQLSNVGWP